MIIRGKIFYEKLEDESFSIIDHIYNEMKRNGFISLSIDVSTHTCNITSDTIYSIEGDALTPEYMYT